jgi:hypothetical protein
MAKAIRLSREAVLESFAEVDLGDERLNNRLESIAAKLASAPDKSFPALFATEAELEAFYRFVRNPRVGLDALVAGHFAQTRERVTQTKLALAIHDTTTLSFGDARVRRRTGLGRINRSDQGMLLHATLGVDAQTHAPLGVLDAHVWTRPEESRRALRKELGYRAMRELPSESDRWLAQALRVQQASPTASLLHVMDSEADDYALVAYLAASDVRYCVRGSVNRRLADDIAHNLGDRFASLSSRCTRDIKISSRGRQVGGGRTRHVAREGRIATISVAAATVSLKRPKELRASEALPESLSVNVVRVWEQSPPDGEVPVHWVLLTSEPIDTDEAMLAVVDVYRQRWLAEEYFKALKTGCSYEARQLDSSETLQAVLGLFIPIASQLLALRALERDKPQTPASAVLSKAELFVLAKQFGRTFPARPTVADALTAIARLGGHIKNNGAPGWIVLSRGYEELARLAAFADNLGVEM